MTSSKRPKITPKWPLLALAFSLPQHLLLGFRFQNNKLRMDEKTVDQGCLEESISGIWHLAFPGSLLKVMERGWKCVFHHFGKCQSVFLFWQRAKSKYIFGICIRFLIQENCTRFLLWRHLQGVNLTLNMSKITWKTNVQMLALSWKITWGFFFFSLSLGARVQWGKNFRSIGPFFWKLGEGGKKTPKKSKMLKTLTNLLKYCIEKCENLKIIFRVFVHDKYKLFQTCSLNFMVWSSHSEDLWGKCIDRRYPICKMIQFEVS